MFLKAAHIMEMLLSVFKLRSKMSCEKLIEEKKARIQNRCNIKANNGKNVSDIKKWLKVLKLYVFVISLLLLNTQISGSWFSIFDYIWPKRNARLFDGNVHNLPKVPFEIGDRDEKFILEASKALGLKLTDLDFCQQKIMLSLRSSCSSLNDEQIGKLAILLMNCQLEAEGQRGQECTDSMSLGECASSLSNDMRQLYYNYQHRAKTMCLVIRHDQFRALAEMTVNRLMAAAHENINQIDGLKRSHHELQGSAVSAIEEIKGGNAKLLEQQHDLLKIAERQRITAAYNLDATQREKTLLKSGHAEVSTMISDLRNQIKDGLSDFQERSEQARVVYDNLLNDIVELQGATEKIGLRLDEASNLILEQSKLTKSELKDTVAQLREVNDIILSLSAIMKEFQDGYKEKMQWLRLQVGGSEELIIKNISTAVIHVLYLLVGMLCLIFVNSDTASRVLFLALVCLNLIAVLYGFIQLDVATLTQTISLVLATKYAYQYLRHYNLKKYFEIGTENAATEQLINGNTETINSARHKNFTNFHSSRSESTTVRTAYQFDRNNNGDLDHDGSVSARIRKQYFNERRTPTPALYTQLTTGEDPNLDRSRSSTPFSGKSSFTTNGSNRCAAKTQRGIQCQLTAASGTSYCRVHDRPSYVRLNEE